MGPLYKVFSPVLKYSSVYLLIAGSALMFGVSALAEPDAIAFDDLSPEIQDSLSPFADRWQQIPPQRQQMLIRFSKDADPDMRKRLKRHANHWKGLPVEERKKVRKAIRKFENLPPHKRQQLRQRWNNMPAEKRRRIDQAFTHYEQLSAEKQKQIREKVRSMSPEERREFLNEIQRHRDKPPPAADKQKSQQ
jgi:hypothetical protein